jgi:hypothetical protein
MSVYACIRRGVYAVQIRSDVCDKMLNSCPNILALVDLVLTLPASSAEAERGFNRLRMAKSDWRGKRGDVHLQMLHFDPLTAIHAWNSSPRRIVEN